MEGSRKSKTLGACIVVILLAFIPQLSDTVTAATVQSFIEFGDCQALLGGPITASCSDQFQGFTPYGSPPNPTNTHDLSMSYQQGDTLEIIILLYIIKTDNNYHCFKMHMYVFTRANWENEGINSYWDETGIIFYPDEYQEFRQACNSMIIDIPNASDISDYWLVLYTCDVDGNPWDSQNYWICLNIDGGQ